MRVRMGIHSGRLGGLGGQCRTDRICGIGDAVNCASRLESYEKDRHKGVLRVLLSSAVELLRGFATPLSSSTGV